MPNASQLRKEIRAWIIFFIVSLLLSGITAFPVETELGWVYSWMPAQHSSLSKWLHTCYQAIKSTNEQYPYLAYGYDWLAFAHIVIAIAFIGPINDPVKNIWIIEFGCIACLAVIPLAFIAGPIRHIPVYWQLIDCSFGIIGLIPLLICRMKIKQLEKAIA
ncbi:hypothetical protein A4D02_32765 [Niastella koreensis]|uniref:Transmembrane protein n=2 Tax=Niastella koreensis TaxID=354356 RepID=G8T7G1_NIAKG|nr:hypothetical protein [Niastella koreensis]AEW01197.1 hypothetical protein Niako_4957 [Niastella koreensis GR20-10]OQP45965.1 hypothetical protein A4D02_32765 [Niastella koreensis]